MIYFVEEIKVNIKLSDFENLSHQRCWLNKQIGFILQLFDSI